MTYALVHDEEGFVDTGMTVELFAERQTAIKEMARQITEAAIDHDLAPNQYVIDEYNGRGYLEVGDDYPTWLVTEAKTRSIVF